MLEHYTEYACHVTQTVPIRTALCCTYHTFTIIVSMLRSMSYALHATLYTLCCTYYTTHTLHSIPQMLTTHALLSNLYYKCYTSHNIRNSTKRTVVYTLNYAHLTKYEHFTVHATLCILTIHTIFYMLY